MQATNPTKCIVYYGDQLYWDSGTIMSPLYSEAGDRYDWGFISRDLQDGHIVLIRPASRDEMAAKSEELRIRFGERSKR